MTSNGNWLELAGPLVACVLGASTTTNLSLCVLVGRSQLLLPPPSASERGRILLAPFHQVGRPNTLTLISQGPDESNGGGAPGNPCFSGGSGIPAPHLGLSGCQEPLADGRRGEAQEEVPGTPSAERPTRRGPELESSVQTGELNKEPAHLTQP